MNRIPFPAALPVTAFLALTFLLLPGCSLKQEYTLREDLSGEMTFDLSMDDIFVSSMEEILLFSSPQGGGDAPPEFLTPELFRREWEKVEGGTLENLEKPDRRNMEGTVSFSNIFRLFSAESGFTGTPALTINRKEKEGTTRIVFHLDRENYQIIAQNTPLLNTPALETFGPLENRESTPEEYRDMVSTFLGPEGPPALRDSQITVIIHTEGRILNHQGGTLKGPRTFEYSQPLIEYLLLRDPLHFELTLDHSGG